METTRMRMSDHYSKLLSICLLVLLNTRLVRSDSRLTWIDSAVSKGAVCMDGSAPAYSLEKGYGSGANNWFIYIEGGGWCESAWECENRARGRWPWMGSSAHRHNKTYYTGGLLSPNQTYNPDFYNWNIVYLVYCDGSSFLGDVEEVDPQTNLTYRGSRVFNAIMEDLLAKGMNNADNAVLAGSSAGGLTTILHCDNFHALLPNANRVKCISDSGFFLHAKNLPGAKEREEFFTQVIELHGLEKYLPASCTSKMNPGLVKDMWTPNIGGGKQEWDNCVAKNLKFCNSTQLEIIQEFQKTFIDTLQNLKYSSSRGMFVHTCYVHTHIHANEDTACSFLMDNLLRNKTVAEAIGDWYFDRSCFQEIDTSNNVPRNCTSALKGDAFYEQCIERLEHEHRK